MFVFVTSISEALIKHGTCAGIDIINPDECLFLPIQCSTYGADVRDSHSLCGPPPPVPEGHFARNDFSSFVEVSERSTLGQLPLEFFELEGANKEDPRNLLP